MDTASNDIPDLEVALKSDPAKAIIEGKTTVSFQSLVGLVLQRKVMQLTKQWGKAPVIISSELLTAIASAPQDNKDNQEHVTFVTLGIGIAVGILVSCVVMMALVSLQVPVGIREYALVAGTIAGVAALGWLLMQVQGKSSAEKVSETMEKVAGFLK